MLAVEGKWVWDWWFVDVGDTYHAFFLQASRSLGDPELRHANASVGHAISNDLTSWTVLPDALAAGEAGAFDDAATWTGCAVPNRDGWTMFYTGLTAGRAQRIGRADSTDLITWRKHPRNPLLASDPRWYEPTSGDGRSQPAWRDPWVYRGAGRVPHADHRPVRRGPHTTPWRDRQGTLARDLLEWHVDAPLTTPSDFAELEVPQLVELSGRDVLVFSCGPEGLSPARLAEPAGGGSYYLVIDDQPTSSAGAVALDLPGLYACRVVWDRAGEPMLIGFVNRDDAGNFGGLLSDPVPLRAAAPELFR